MDEAVEAFKRVALAHVSRKSGVWLMVGMGGSEGFRQGMYRAALVTGVLMGTDGPLRLVYDYVTHDVMFIREKRCVPCI